MAASVVGSVVAPSVATESPVSISAAEDWSWLAPFAGDATLGAVVIDPAKLDVKFVASLCGSVEGVSPAEAESIARDLTMWRDRLAAEGAAQLCFMLSLKEAGGPPVYIVVRPGQGADVEKLRASVERPWDKGGLGALGLNGTVTAMSGCVLIASESHRVGLGSAQQGDAMNRALAMSGDGPVRVAFFPAEYARRAIAELMPRFPEAMGGGETRVLIDGLVAVGATVETGPEATMRARMGCVGADAATKLAAWINARSAAMPPDLAGVLRAVPDGTQVRVESDGKPLRAAMAQLAKQVLVARRSAAQMAISIKARNAVMGCWMHAQAHNDAFPETLDQLVTDGHITSDVIKGPDGADLFVYTRPTVEQWKANPAGAVMLYEKFTAWPARGLAVGFVDGHTEIIGDRETFEKLLAKPAAAGPGGGLGK
ncbi:MAG: hypothetical protein ACOYN0_05510 [Phycisphaerales bacterium]